MYPAAFIYKLVASASTPGTPGTSPPGTFSEVGILMIDASLFVRWLLFALCVSEVHSQCVPDGEGGWSIGFVFGKDPFNLHSPSRYHNDSYPCVRNPIVSCNSVTDVVASFVADPFLYIPSGQTKWYLFFEVKNKDKSLRRGSGQIGCAVSKDRGQSWQYLRIVFRLDPARHKWQHLSYPFVFEYAGGHYMLPQQWGPSTLFRANSSSFPSGWEQVSTISEYSYIDPNLVFFQGQWWLIGFLSFTNAHFLHVSYSEDPSNPLSRFVDTPFNCISDFKFKNKHAEHSTEEIRTATSCVGGVDVVPHKHVYTTRAFQHVSGLRPGGSVFVHQDRLFRFVQNSGSSYGDSLDLYEITLISKTQPLKEKLVPEFRQRFRGVESVGMWNSVRYHHLSLQFIPSSSYATPGAEGRGGHWVGVADGDGRVDHGGKETAEAAAWRRSDQSNIYALVDNPAQSEAFRLRCVAPKLKALALSQSRDEAGLDKSHLYRVHRQKSTQQRNKELCIFTALSSNHYVEYLRGLEGIMRHYPCNHVYIYDLGLTESQLQFLKATVPMLTVLPLVSTRPFFEFKACVFKPVALLNIIDTYGEKHYCKDVLYMDTSIRFKDMFDDAAYAELDQRGVLAEQQSSMYSQIEFTHPGMYNWFGIDREKDFEEYKLYSNTSSAGARLMQIQAGLMLVNTLNKTIRDSLFVPWKECADNMECLSPDGFVTHWASEKPLREFMVYGTEPVFRAHRDDQSAFTFLMDRNFGHGETQSHRGPIYLNSYVHPVWHTRSNEAKVAAIASRMQCIPV